MKTKILISMSFIFLLLFYSINLYATETLKINNGIENYITNEIDKASQNVLNEKNEKIEESEKVEEIIEEKDNQILVTTDIQEIVLEESENHKYNGRMYVEAPGINKSFIRPDETKMEIIGWASSEDSGAVLRILLDGKVVANNLPRNSRKDVDEIVSPNYGGTTITPNAGFRTSLDIGNLGAGEHTIRVEQLSRYGELISSSDTKFQVINKKYNGRMYVEAPTTNKNFTRPDDNKMELIGWASSEDSGAVLRVLLDGNVVANNLPRHSRKDVDEIVSPAYGGTAVTPNAGFRTSVDIGSLGAGEHSIRVEQLSRYGELISSSDTKFQVINKKYNGRMYVESPTMNKIFTRPDDNKMELIGWASSEDRGAVLRILLDGNVVANNLPRNSRKDVDEIVSPSYGGTAVTPNAGFRISLDIGNLGAGEHTIRVEQLSRYGELISSSDTKFQVINKKYNGRMYVESPTTNKNFIRPDETKMEVIGWASSEDSGAVLRVLLDGNIVANNLPRNSRKDVDEIVSPAYGGTAVTPNAGFRTSVDIGSLGAGEHTIRVEQLSRYGELISSSDTKFQVINKKYNGRMYVESPTTNKNFIRPDDTKMELIGWASSEDSGAILRVLLDGNVVANNLPRHSRKDVDEIVSPAYGGTAVTPNAGFRTSVDIGSLGAGEHTIRVEQLSRYGELISSSDTKFQIINKKYNGEMCIDTPTYNAVYERGKNIAVSGWAVAEDEIATIEIYIDGKWKARADRYYREDIVYYMNKYGSKTVNAGFGKLISTAGLSSGTHKITVYEKSRYGDIIGGVERQFIIKSVETNNTNNNTNNNININNDKSRSINTVYAKGIDVSQHQGTIDWKKVANSGIKFAMIRIGYRGYGTGKLAEDTKFQSNFKGAVQNGLKVGIYYYSTALNTNEAKKDAEYVISVLKKYGYTNYVSMPIAIDLEVNSGINSRDRNVSKTVRTDIANTFCSTISGYGYKPMVYACKAFLNDNMNASKVPYDIWVAQYNSKCTYSGNYTMWQYTSSGKVSGISGNVDCNICYKNY